MKLERRAHAHKHTAHALRALIRAEMAHERVSADASRAAELEAQVQDALERHRRLTGADASLADA